MALEYVGVLEASDGDGDAVAVGVDIPALYSQTTAWLVFGSADWKPFPAAFNSTPLSADLASAVHTNKQDRCDSPTRRAGSRSQRTWETRCPTTGSQCRSSAETRWCRQPTSTAPQVTLVSHPPKRRNQAPVLLTKCQQEQKPHALK